MLDENYLVDKIFYFEDCVFGRDKFNHFIRFQRGGRLEGAPRPSGGVAAVSKGAIDFKPLDGQWVIAKDKIIIDFVSLLGISSRDIMKIEVEIGPDRKDFFPARSESSSDYLFPGYQWDRKTTEVFDCRMRELR